MAYLKIAIENCYGIKKLDHELDYNENSKVVAIYAPNGVMKTSFAKTFDDYSGGKKDSSDAVFKREPCVRLLTGHDGKDLSRENIFVIKSYVDTAYSSENISTLLVRNDLRQQYEAALKLLVSQKKPVLSELSTSTQSSDCEKEIIRTFSDLGDNLFDIIAQLLPTLRSDADSLVTYDFRYNHIFDNKSVEGFVTKNKANLATYYDKFYEVLQNSDGFFAADGSFGTVQALGLSKTISDDAFFKAGHRFLLKNKEAPIESATSFQAMIEEAKNKVLSDPELKKQFDKIDSALAPSTLLPLRNIINKNRDVILELLDFEGFQRKYWLGHLVQIIDKLDALEKQYIQERKVIDAIIAEANNESDQWKDTIRIFKSRFVDLPFDVSVKNVKDTVLGLSKPQLIYKFVDNDTGESKEISREDLTDFILSNGEKRAFYLLNIIFEIQSRLIDGKETLFVIDDIADSFDYKNKYAIVEYLHDISQNENFYSIILTHNFDFYRTITLRLKIKEDSRLFAQKEIDHIELIKESDACPMDPFKIWKKTLDEVHILALIPFVRNLIEYGRFNAPSFLLLTNLLHKKSELKFKQDGKLYNATEIANYNESIGDFTVKSTDDITYADIESIYVEYLGIDKFSDALDKTQSISERIIDTAANMDGKASLENKIVLAMAVRHLSESYMISKINNSNWVDKITNSQTSELIKKFKGKVKCSDIPEASLGEGVLELLEKVNIITPENIHINSFMYEPIVDMGIGELQNLFSEVKAKLA